MDQQFATQLDNYLGSEISEILKKVFDSLVRLDVSFRSPSSEVLERFYNLDSDLKKSTYQKLILLKNELQLIEEEKVDIKDTKSHLSWFLDRYELKLDSRFLNSIGDDDIVEVYNNSFEQTFRNFKLLEITGYSLLDLNTYNWPELFWRPDSVNKKLIELAQLTLSGELDFSPIDIRQHAMKENFSDTKQTMKIQHRFGTPVLGSGSIQGFACSQQAVEILVHINPTGGNA